MISLYLDMNCLQILFLIKLVHKNMKFEFNINDLYMLGSWSKINNPFYFVKMTFFDNYKNGHCEVNN